MLKQILTISETHQHLMELADQLNRTSEPTIITRDDQPVMVLMSYDTYTSMKQVILSLYEKVESLEETLEILQDEDAMKAFRQGVADIEAGRTHPLEEVLKELGWD